MLDLSYNNNTWHVLMTRYYKSTIRVFIFIIQTTIEYYWWDKTRQSSRRWSGFLYTTMPVLISMPPYETYLGVLLE